MQRVSNNSIHTLRFRSCASALLLLGAVGCGGEGTQDGTPAATTGAQSPPAAGAAVPGPPGVTPAGMMQPAGVGPDPANPIAPGVVPPPGQPQAPAPGVPAPPAAPGVVAPGVVPMVAPEVPVPGVPVVPAAPGAPAVPVGTPAPVPSGPPPPPPEPPSKCMLSDPNSLSGELIHDVEGGTPTAAVGGSTGTWYVSSDDATQQTPVGNFTTTSGIEGPGALSSMYALHATLVVPDNAEWGGVSQLTFNKALSVPQWQGIKFFAKGSGDVRVKLVSANTVPVDEGGTCSDGCSDSHGIHVSLAPEWTEVKVYFTEVRQIGFGAKVDFDPSALMGIGIQAQEPGTYDFWVDNVQFFTDEGMPDCTEYPGDSRCEPTKEYCMECEDDARCECVLEECITSAVITGPLACNQQAMNNKDGGSTRYWISQMSSDRDTSGGYEALACGNPVISKGNDQGSAASQDKVVGAPGDGLLFGALNSSDFGKEAVLCGACVRVNDKVTIQIVDECPNRPGAQSNPICTPGHIDLSVAAANIVGGDNPRISWKMVPCEDTKPQYFWHWDSKVFWGALTITGLTYPAAKVELKKGSTWMVGKHKPYWGAWVFGKDEEIPGSGGTLPPPPWQVRVTDVHGQVMVDRFTSGSGDYPNPVQNGQAVPYEGEGMIQLPVCGM